MVSLKQIRNKIASWLLAWTIRHAVAAAVLMSAIGTFIGYSVFESWPVMNLTGMMGILWGLWLSGWFLRTRQGWCAFVVALMFLALGMCNAQRRGLPAADDMIRFVSYFYGERAVLEGRVLSEPRVSQRVPKTRFLFDVRRMSVNTCVLRVRGTVLAQVFRRLSVQKGDRLRLIGRVHTFYRAQTDPKTRGSYVASMRRRGIHFVVSVKKTDPVVVMDPVQRSWWGRTVERITEKAQTPFVSRTAKAVVDAMIWGRREGLPDAVMELFRRTGTAHLLAISGFHVGCLCLFILFVLRGLRMPWWCQLSLAAAVLILYGCVVGWRPSVTRAVVMACCAMAALGMGREPLSLNTLAVAAGLILAVDPSQLFEPGFRLSFSCVAVMITMIPLLQRIIRHVGAQGVIKQAFTVASACLAAWLGAVGWIWYHFQAFHPYSVAINMIVCPWAMVVVVLGWILWLGAPIPGLLRLIGPLENGLIEGMLSFLRWCTLLPGVEMTLPPLGITGLFVYYGLLGGCVWLTAQLIRSGETRL